MRPVTNMRQSQRGHNVDFSALDEKKVERPSRVGDIMHCNVVPHGSVDGLVAEDNRELNCCLLIVDAYAGSGTLPITPVGGGPTEWVGLIQGMPSFQLTDGPAMPGVSAPRVSLTEVRVGLEAGGYRRPDTPARPPGLDSSRNNPADDASRRVVPRREAFVDADVPPGALRGIELVMGFAPPSSANQPVRGGIPHVRILGPPSVLGGASDRVKSAGARSKAGCSSL